MGQCHLYDILCHSSWTNQQNHDVKIGLNVASFFFIWAKALNLGTLIYMNLQNTTVPEWSSFLFSKISRIGKGLTSIIIFKNETSLKSSICLLATNLSSDLPLVQWWYITMRMKKSIVYVFPIKVRQSLLWEQS